MADIIVLKMLKIKDEGIILEKTNLEFERGI